MFKHINLSKLNFTSYIAFMKEIVNVLNKAKIDASNINHSFQKFNSTINNFIASYHHHRAINDNAITLAKHDFERDCIMHSITLIAHAHENDTHLEYSEISIDFLHILKTLDSHNIKRSYSQNTNHISAIIKEIVSEKFIQYIKYTGLVPWIAKLEKINHKIDLMLIAHKSLEKNIAHLPTLSTLRFETDRSWNILLRNLNVYKHIVESQIPLVTVSNEINLAIDKYCENRSR